MLIDRSYFWGNLTLTYAERTASTGDGLSALVGVGSKQIEIERYISKYENRALYLFLGIDLTELFVTWLEAQTEPIEPIEPTEPTGTTGTTGTTEEVEEIDYCEETYQLTDEDFTFLKNLIFNEEAKISPIANYIWLKVEENTINTKTVRASIKEKVGNNISVSNATQQIEVYNEYVELANTVIYKLSNNEHFCRYFGQLRLLKKANRFWV